MSNRQKEQIKNLRAEGYSVREIADELSLPKSSVGNIIKESRGQNLAGDDDDDEQPQPIPAAKQSRADAELAGLRAEVARKDALLEQERRNHQREVEQQRAELSGIQAEKERQEALHHELLEGLDEQETARQAAREDKFVAKYEALVEEFLGNCQDSTWTVGELEELADRADTLREKIERHCEKHDIDAEQLAIQCFLSELGDAAAEFKADERSPKKRVTVDVSDEDRKRMRERWTLAGFDDELVEPNDEDEEDEDDEEVDEAPIRGNKSLAGAETSSGSGIAVPLVAGGFMLWLFSRK